MAAKRGALLRFQATGATMGRITEIDTFLIAHTPLSGSLIQSIARLRSNFPVNVQLFTQLGLKHGKGADGDQAKNGQPSLPKAKPEAVPKGTGTSGVEGTPGKDTAGPKAGPTGNGMGIKVRAGNLKDLQVKELSNAQDVKAVLATLALPQAPLVDALALMPTADLTAEKSEATDNGGNQRAASDHSRSAAFIFSGHKGRKFGPSGPDPGSDSVIAAMRDVVSYLQRKKHKVAITLNDCRTSAPVAQVADLGIVVGNKAFGADKQGADLRLQTSLLRDLNPLCDLLTIAKATVRLEYATVLARLAVAVIVVFTMVWRAVSIVRFDSYSLYGSGSPESSGGFAPLCLTAGCLIVLGSTDVAILSITALELPKKGNPLPAKIKAAERAELAALARSTTSDGPSTSATRTPAPTRPGLSPVATRQQAILSTAWVLSVGLFFQLVLMPVLQAPMPSFDSWLQWLARSLGAGLPNFLRAWAKYLEEPEQQHSVRTVPIQVLIEDASSFLFMVVGAQASLYAFLRASRANWRCTYFTWNWMAPVSAFVLLWLTTKGLVAGFEEGLRTSAGLVTIFAALSLHALLLPGLQRLVPSLLA